MKTKKSKSSGFTVLEFVFVMMMIGLMGGVAQSAYSDFKDSAEEKIALYNERMMQDAVSNMKKKAVLKCGASLNDNPGINSITENNIGHSADGLCNEGQLSGASAKFLVDTSFPLVNPMNGLSNIGLVNQPISQGDAYINGSCSTESSGSESYGWCYDQDSGVLFSASSSNTVAIIDSIDEVEEVFNVASVDDGNNGHGNDEDCLDDSNPGKSTGCHKGGNGVGKGNNK